jgi:hypothetical protein
MIRSVRNTDAECSITRKNDVDAGGKLADFPFTLLDSMRLLGRVWCALDDSVIRNCFKKAGFRFDVDVPAPPIDHGDNVFDVARNLIGDVLSDTTMLDYVNVDHDAIAIEPLSDQDILDSIRNADNSNSESEDEPPAVEKRLTLSEVFAHLQALKQFSAENSILKQFGDFEEAIVALRLKCMTQTTISQYFQPELNQKAISPSEKPSTSSAPSEATAQVCAVCNLACDGAHFCSSCFLAVHAICGETTEEEGYGAPVRCRLCLQQVRKD